MTLALCWGGGLSKRSSQSTGCILGLFSRSWSRPLHAVRAPHGSWGRLRDSRTALPTGFAQALPLALCPQAERVPLQARAHAQTGCQPEPGPAAGGAHVSDWAQPMGAVEGWGLPAQNDLCPQADLVFPGPGAADCPPGSANVADRGAYSQVSPARDSGRGAVR